MKILVTDDNQVARKILCNFLNKYGQVDEASSGREAIEAVRHALKKNPYTVIFLDIIMPLIDGHDVLKTIRSLEKKAGCTGSQRSNIIMVTSVAAKETIDKSVQGLADGHLLKPIDQESITLQLQRLKLI